MHRWSGNPRAHSQAGSFLLELLMVVLILGLITAAFISKSPDLAKLSSPTSETPDSPILQQALTRWVTDPSESPTSSAEVPFDAEVDGLAYESTIHELKTAGLLESWTRLLESRLPEQHPLRTALASREGSSMQSLQPSDSAEPLVRWTQPPVEGPTNRGTGGGEIQDTEKDPEMAWSDGQPVSVTTEKP